MSYSIHKQAVRAAFNDFVMVNQTLVKHFKDANPALFLGYLISEDTYLEKVDKLDQWGFFYCTSSKIEEKYGFSYKLQDRIIGQLVKAGLIQVTVKRVEGSESISKKRHFKVLYENVSHLVNGTKPHEKDCNGLAEHLEEIQNALMKFAKERRANYVKTAADEKILKIASMHGLVPEIIIQSINERHKRLKAKDVTAKYLLSAFIPNLSDFEHLPDPYRKSELILPLG